MEETHSRSLESTGRDRRSAVIVPQSMRTALFAALLIASAISTIGCKKEAEQEESSPPVTADVKVAAIRLGSMEETITASGSTTNLRESQLRSPIGGVLSKFQYFNGDALKKGETIAVIQTKESQSSIRGAEKLLQSAATPSQREEAEKALALAKESATTAVITAPFTGILNNKLKNEQELVAEDEPIASLIDPGSIVFIADVPSRSLSSIRDNQPATVRFPMIPGRIFRGVIKRIEPMVNPADQTAHVQISFSEPGVNLQRSLFGDVTIVTGKRNNILLAPVAAILRNDEENTSSVMVAGNDSLAHKVDVTVIARQDSIVGISSKDLSAGTRVIIQGHYGLPDSTRIRIVQ